jgi:hypothetical protein
VSANLPQPDHVVVVVFENHSFDEIVDPNRASFIYRLATGGALFVNAFAVTHPSQPNYFALFSGSTQGVRLLPMHCPLSALFMPSTNPRQGSISVYDIDHAHNFLKTMPTVTLASRSTGSRSTVDSAS